MFLKPPFEVFSYNTLENGQNEQPAKECFDTFENIGACQKYFVATLDLDQKRFKKQEANQTKQKENYKNMKATCVWKKDFLGGLFESKKLKVIKEEATE